MDWVSYTARLIRFLSALYGYWMVEGYGWYYRFGAAYGLCFHVSSGFPRQRLFIGMAGSSVPQASDYLLSRSGPLLCFRSLQLILPSGSSYWC